MANKLLSLGLALTAGALGLSARALAQPGSSPIVPGGAGVPTPAVARTAPPAPGMPLPGPGAPVVPGLPGSSVPGAPGMGMPSGGATPPGPMGFVPLPGPSATGIVPGSPQPYSSPASYSNQVHVLADAVSYDRKNKIATARGNVDVKYQGVHLNTEFLELDQASNSVWTDQPFILTQGDPKGDQTVRGTALTYGLKTHDATVSDAFLAVPAPAGGQTVYVSGRALTSKGNRKYDIEHGTFTTCDEVLQERTPHYHVTSDHLELAPDDYAMGWNSWVYVNNERLLWLPVFWVPLRKRQTNIVFGQNDVEGYFVKGTLGYTINDQHSGTLYLNYMQKKGPGIGFSHTWSEVPYQLSLFEAYGLPQPDTDPTWNYVHGIDNSHPHPFQDYLWHIRHQQRLLDTMTVDVSAEDYDIYTIQNAQSVIGPNVKLPFVPANETIDQALAGYDIRDDHAANSLSVTDQRNGVTWDFNRQWRQDRQDRGTNAPQPGAMGTPVNTAYSGDVNWAHDQTAVKFNSKFTAQTPYLYPTPIPSPTPSLAPGGFPAPSPAPTATPDLQSTTTFDNTLHVDQRLPGDIQASWDNHYTHNVTPGAAGASTNETEELEEKLDFDKDIGWASTHLSVDKLFVFKPFYYAFNPSMVASPSALIARGFVEKLPELTLTTKPILPDIQPFTVTA
ncbi:MAG: hypothetical protein KGR26_04700, partial [Cyanobacteria bacterium REEB65]|nr:hypothetical protein [Cyanobacteria bacterium REEB65]